MELTTEVLLLAYSQGVFPMAHSDGRIYWYDPHPRAIIPLDAFHTPRSLQRVVKNGRFTIRTDTAFRQVMEACAAPAAGREDTWINQEFLEAYTRLNQLGFAHSVETWFGDELVGGLYGVTLGGFFAGESMFSWADNASKVALVHLVARLRRGGYQLLDTQFMTEHLRRFGTIEIPRNEYKRRLARALQVQGEWDNATQPY